MGSEPDDDLEDRVERLEEQLSKTMPSRRQLLAGAGTLGVGALLGGGAGSAAAADGTTDESVGAVGAQGSSVDVYLDQLLDESGDEVLNVDDSGTANATGRGWEFDSINTEDSNSTINVAPGVQGESDIGGAFNAARQEHGERSVVYNLEPGEYTATTSFDLTGIRADDKVTLDMRGATINQDVPVLLDLTGSHNAVRIVGGTVFARAGSSAQVGLLLGRASDDLSAGNNNFIDVRFAGDFSEACVWNVASEVNTFVSCHLSTKIGGVDAFNVAGARAMIISHTSGPVTSPYADLVGSSQVTATQNRIFGGTLVGHTGLELRPSTDCPVQSVTINGAFAGAVDEAVLFNYVDGGEIKEVALRDLRITDNIPKSAVEDNVPSGTGSADGLLISGGKINSENIDIALGNVDVTRAAIDRNTIWMSENGLVFNNLIESDVTLAGIQDITANEFEECRIGVQKESRATGTLTRSEIIELRDGRRILNSGGGEFRKRGTYFGTNSKQDLSAVTGNFEGELRRDDGSNFDTGEYARWEPGAGEWVALSDPSNRVSPN